jgi:hypothetical protein
MRRERKVTVIEVAIRRVGFRRGRRAVMFAACWWITTHELGRSPETIEEYAENWKQSRAQAFRDQADFRGAFPEYPTPTELAEAIGFDVAAVGTDQPDDVLLQLMGVAAP